MSEQTHDLDRELKWVEVELKKEDLLAKRKGLEQGGGWLARWNNPLGLAVLTALLGVVGSLFSWKLDRQADVERHKHTLEIEKEKLQGMLVLDAMKTGEGPEKAKQAAINLLLLADADLVTFNDKAVSKLKDWSEGKGGTGPGLPAQSQPRHADLSSLLPGATVEIIHGGLKGSKGEVTAVQGDKIIVRVNLLNGSHELPFDTSNVKIIPSPP